MADAARSYGELIEAVRELSLVQSVSALLSWDQETMMPKGGEELRARQMALLAGLAHDRATNPKIGDLLNEVAPSAWLKDAPAATRANVAEVRRTFDRQTKLPKSLVEELARTIPVAQGAWAAARKRADFKAFLPHLQKIVALKRDEAQALSTGGDLYDALLDEHEPGMKTADAARMIDGLAQGLVPIVRAIAARGNGPSVLDGKTFAVDKQRVLCATLPPALGLVPDQMRLDVSSHPFSQRIGKGDVRITTRFDPADLRGAFFGTLHETGHALYEEGLDPAHDGTPAGEARSLGVHESQSRLWENLVGRSRPFWRHYFPLVRSMFPEVLGGATLDDVHRAVNRVEASFIRVEADEVTYSLHIVVRMRLERRILSGDLNAQDVPAAWNEEMNRTLGIVPPNDAQGCLQDVHWSVGAFAYFPTYALGNMFGAQLFEAAQRDLPALDDDLEHGEFAPLLSWLRAKVHMRGTQASGSQIVQDATGKPPDASAFLRYVRAKYAPLYGLRDADFEDVKA